jgi:Tol biopolymer transport system component
MPTIDLSSAGARARRAAALALAALGALAGTIALATPLDAQYFGRNKVRYDTFDFRALATEHFDVYYYPAESIATADAARMAERWYARHSTLLGFESGRSPIIFYADHPDFQQTSVIGGFIGEGTGGVTEGARERVIMPFTGSYAETDHVLGHELVHVYQYRIAKATKAGLRSLDGIPLWLIEGMAEYLSLGRDDPNTAMWLRDAVRRNDLPTLKQLTTDPDYFPYRYGQAFWAFIGGTYGDEAVGRLFRNALARGWENGILSTLRIRSDSLGKLWHAEIRSQYGPTFAGRTSPDSTGRAVVRVTETGDQNVAPAVSSDGRYVTYFSSRDLFGIDLYLAELATGRVIRKLTEVTANAHFDALSFINSSGSFSPEGDRIAVVTVADGDNDITIFRTSDGDVDRRLKVRGVTAMSDPAWSPDGKSIAFAGLSGGISDLFVYDLASGQARRLTNGREAELQPAWSPDGRTIAFATDRGPDTDFGNLAFGEMRLATIAAEGGEPRALATFPRGKSINPQYTPDGRSIYFVSDQDGVSDVYRVATDGSGSPQRVTNVATGVSGISGGSPALSVASRTGTLVFSVFDRSGFAIRSMDAPSGTVAEGPAAGTEPVAGILPPATPVISDGGVARLLADDATGLAAPSALRPTKVDRRLRLEYIGGPSIGVTFGGGYGSGLGGGVGLGFTDMLGNHELGFMVQAQGDIKDIGGSVYYLNNKRRWSWGAQAGHIPYAGIFATAENVVIDDGQGGTIPATVFVQQLQRVYFDNVDLLAQYPFSLTKRVEMSAGLQHIGFDVEVDSQLVIGNQLVDHRRVSVSGGPAVNLGRGAAAFVHDNSFSAFTSPIAGSRYRIEAGGNLGDLNYQDALVDYRRYFFLRPFTLAVRGIHFGRYGADAENELTQPLFVGQSQLIRGYEAHTFDFDECTQTATSGCAEFDRLNGSRIAVLNAEFRIPLLGNDRFGIFSVPFVPTEITPFVDAGLAWNSDESPELRFDRETSERVPVVSAGVTTRINLLGFAVVEIFYARHFQRPTKGAIWGFQLSPGW